MRELFFVFLLALPLLALEVVRPVENSLVREAVHNVIVKVDPKEIDYVEVITDEGDYRIEMKASKESYCKNISLQLGENRVTVRTYKAGRMVEEQIRHLYLTSPVHHEYRYPPEKFESYFFHNDANEALCKNCHDMTSNEVEGVAFINVEESNCFECHRTLIREKYAHAPAVNWLCTACHNGKSGRENRDDEGKSKYLVSEPVNKLCFKCHKENRRLWNRTKYRHEPLDSGRCNKCHNSHSTPYRNFVRKPTNQICLGCHKDKRIASLQRNSDCLGTEGGKLCTRCHTPHASNREFFLKEDLSSIDETLKKGSGL